MEYITFMYNQEINFAYWVVQTENTLTCFWDNEIIWC